ETFETPDEMRAMVESNPGNYDIVIADEATSRDLSQLKLIQSINFEELEGKKHLDPRFWHPDLGVENPSFIPYVWGSTIAAYRADLLDLEEEEFSWNLFWDDRVEGMAAFSEEPTEIYAIAQARNGLPMHSTKEKDRRKAIDDVKSAMITNGVELGYSWDNLERLDSGELVLVHCYSGEAAVFAAENENIVYFLPKEGVQLWTDGFMIARDSERSEAAHRFIDFMLRPESAAATSNEIWFLTPNLAALDDIDPELLADEVFNPSEEYLAKCSVIPALDIAHVQANQLGMHEILTAVEAARSSHEPFEESLLEVKGTH
ncbi:MAG: spermidine/putrescine ABC transporter substrate-binding protein, partial [Verrucomicrobiota bacterium]